MARLKRKKQIKQNKGIIKTSVLKIVVLFVIVGLNWTGLLAVGKTLAYFFDNENSNANTFAAGTLDFHLRSGQTNFYPYDKAEDLKPGDSVARDIYIDNDGTLPFKYTAQTEKISGDDDFCGVLQLKTWLYTVWPRPSGQNMQLEYSGPLMDLTFPAIEISGYEGQEDRWYFQVSLPLGTPEENYKDKFCDFKFIFDGWQVDFDYLSGFSNTEDISNYIADPSSIVLNEFLPIAGDYPEFVELYNRGDTYPVDIANWLIESQSTIITINSDILYGSTTNTIIEPGEWLVIDLSKVGEDILDDEGDIITLYDSENNEIDTISYDGAIIIDKTYARIPDGSPNWVDPIPTPGTFNQLGDDEIIEIAETQEFIMENIVQEPVRETCEQNGANRPCGCEIGACQIGVQICEQGIWGKCIGAVMPTYEICDEVDNDCDGEVDEGGVCSLSQLLGVDELPFVEEEPLVEEEPIEEELSIEEPLEEEPVEEEPVDEEEVVEETINENTNKTTTDAVINDENIETEDDEITEEVTEIPDEPTEEPLEEEPTTKEEPIEEEATQEEPVEELSVEPTEEEPAEEPSEELLEEEPAIEEQVIDQPEEELGQELGSENDDTSDEEEGEEPEDTEDSEINLSE